jgi:hypothetical protein
LPRKRSRTSTQAISVPLTTLMAAVASETSSVKRNAATAWRLVTTSKNEPSIARTATAASGSSTMTLSHSVATPSRQGARPVGRAPQGEGEGAHFAVETPASSSILATEPFSGSNISSLTFFQPPRSSIVNSPRRVREPGLVRVEDLLVDGR